MIIQETKDPAETYDNNFFASDSNQYVCRHIQRVWQLRRTYYRQTKVRRVGWSAEYLKVHVHTKAWTKDIILSHRIVEKQPRYFYDLKDALQYEFSNEKELQNEYRNLLGSMVSRELQETLGTQLVRRLFG